MLHEHPILRSTLEGIFGSAVGYSSQEAASSLRHDLAHKSFRDALQAELKVALSNPAFAWRQLLEECKVAHFETDHEAMQFVVQHVEQPARAHWSSTAGGNA